MSCLSPGGGPHSASGGMGPCEGSRHRRPAPGVPPAPSPPGQATLTAVPRAGLAAEKSFPKCTPLRTRSLPSTIMSAFPAARQSCSPQVCLLTQQTPCIRTVSGGCLPMSLSQQGLPASVPIAPCWASRPARHPPHPPCQPMYPHAGTQHGLLCPARSQHNSLRQPHGQLGVMPVHGGPGRRGRN